MRGLELADGPVAGLGLSVPAPPTTYPTDAGHMNAVFADSRGGLSASPRGPQQRLARARCLVHELRVRQVWQSRDDAQEKAGETTARAIVGVMACLQLETSELPVR